MIDLKHLAEDIIFWRIECRTCEDRIVFGIRRHPEYGDAMSFLCAGTFRCKHGHAHKYFSGDLTYFRLPDGSVNMDRIERNRAAYVPVPRPQKRG